MFRLFNSPLPVKSPWSMLQAQTFPSLSFFFFYLWWIFYSSSIESAAVRGWKDVVVSPGASRSRWAHPAQGVCLGPNSRNPLNPALLQIIRTISHLFIYINFQTAILLKIGFHYWKQKWKNDKYRKETNKKQTKKQINTNCFHLTDFLNMRPENLGYKVQRPIQFSQLLIQPSCLTGRPNGLRAKTQAVGVASLSLLGLGLPGHVAQVEGLMKGERGVNA